MRQRPKYAVIAYSHKTDMPNYRPTTYTHLTAFMDIQAVFVFSDRFFCFSFSIYKFRLRAT